MKTALINCYFGKLPNYFELWLQSCAANPLVDFILFTDSEVQYTVPTNVSIHKTTFDNLIERIQSKFDFRVAITSPYKLTDFKPAYGYIFEDILKPYDYWGYCDLDLIFGNLISFIQKPMELGKEKIYRLGHLTIYKNIEKLNKLFQERGAAFTYRKVFSTPEFYSFDEHVGQMMIASRHNISQYYEEDMADISCRIKRMTASRHENYPFQVFYYEDGSVHRAYVKDGKVGVEEFAYIHIQKRKYQYDELHRRFYILSDRFVGKQPGIPDAVEIEKRSEYISDETDQKQLAAFRKKKINDFLRSPVKEKWIWLKIKMAERQFK